MPQGFTSRRSAENYLDNIDKVVASGVEYRIKHETRTTEYPLRSDKLHAKERLANIKGRGQRSFLRRHIPRITPKRPRLGRA